LWRKIKSLFKRKKPVVENTAYWDRIKKLADERDETRPERHKSTNYLRNKAGLKPIPVHNSFKPRPAYEKKTWGNQKRLPRNFKDEDEENEARSN
jgi:hypothetical protein